MAVVAESRDDRSVVFRTYCSQWPLFGHHQVRAPILGPGSRHPGGVVGQYEAALEAGAAMTCRPRRESAFTSAGPDGRLAAVRVYDDVEAPVGRRR